MKKRLFPLLIALSALLVAGSAAFYSVFGLSKLFAGAATQVIIMAGSLEFAKLVSASLLYQYWGTINKVLKGYLMVAIFTLMIITSGGIYGFLSGAYQSTAVKSELLDKSLAILEQKQVRFEETKEDLTLEKTQINKSISDLRISLSNPQQVSWYDKNSETVITSTSGSARRALQAELKTTIIDRDKINLKLEAILDSIGKTDMALLNKEISNEDERELGPLKYLASTTGWPMDKVVNYFLLLIVFVFDPLAIALVVAANFAFAQIRKPEEIVIEEYVDDDTDFDADGEPIKEEQKEDNTTEPSESLKQRVKENQDKLKEIEIDEDYFSELEGYIKYIKEEDIENLTYPQFIDKHYTKDEKQINTYGDDDWATPTEEEEITVEEDLTYPEFVDKHYPKEITVDGGEIEVTVEPTKEQMEEPEDEIRIITSEEDLSEEELNELSREIGKTETTDELTPINPTEEELEKLEEILEDPKPIEPTKKDLEKLSKALNIKYDDDNVPLDRLTDTTQTLITKVTNKDNEKEYSGNTLTYKGRK